MRSDTAIERLARVLDMVPLLSKSELTAEELARMFNTDPQTIRRDLEIAFLCGLPGYTPDLLIDIDLEGESYSVLDPQVLDRPRRIGAEEISILLLGLELIQTLMITSRTTQNSIETLIRKLTDSHTNQINDLARLETDDRLMMIQSLIETAIAKEKDLRFEYVDSLGVQSKREVTPLRLFWRGSRGFFEAFDHGKNEKRHFFLSAMKDLTLIERVKLPAKKSLPDSEHSMIAELRFTELPGWWLRRHSPFIQEVHNEGMEVVVAIQYWKREWLIRATISVVDTFLELKDSAYPESEFRQDLLSYISGA